MEGVLTIPSEINWKGTEPTKVDEECDKIVEQARRENVDHMITDIENKLKRAKQNGEILSSPFCYAPARPVNSNFPISKEEQKKYCEKKEDSWKKYNIKKTDVTSIKFSENIEYIMEYSFQGCSNLKEINIPQSVKYIREYSFQGCTNLVSLEIPESVVYIYKNAFQGLINLKTLKFSSESKLEIIYHNAFQGCISLKNLVIPKSVQYIYNNAFQGLTNLERITFASGSKLEYIFDNVFKGCVKLEAIDIPESVKYIYKDAFQGCSNLKNISIPPNVKFLGDAFNGHGCDPLEIISANTKLINCKHLIRSN